ncbi:MAG: SPASM domain-containing protein [Candidatus Omnitrophica bacterium]|nr:SPASM domain-containing protein [Candidatus Omnitrophota bacterium]
MNLRPPADYIEITTNIGCPNNCTYCPQGRLIQAYKKISDVNRMSYELFTKCIDKVPAKTNILFSGLSEAWFNPDCTRMLVYAQNKHKILVYTTMSGMSIEDIRILETLPLEEFHLHLPTDENTENIAIDDDYLQKLTYLNESRIKVTYSFFGLNLKKCLEPFLKGKKVLKRDFHSRAGNIYLSKIFENRRKKGKIDCELLYGKGPVLLPNGDVVLCCMDYGLEYILGNLTRNSWVELFSSQAFLKACRSRTDSSIDSICRRCIQSQDVGLQSRINNTLVPLLMLYMKNPKSLFKAMGKIVRRLVNSDKSCK